MFNVKKSLASKSLAVALGFVLVLTAVGFAPSAEAKRMGGGSSFGRQMPIQRQATPPRPAQPAAAPTQAPAQQPAAARQAAGQQPAAAPTRSWMGPLAGIAAGLGLAALASYLGVGAELMSFMLILLAGLAVFAIVRMVMNRNRLQPAGGPSLNGSNTFRTNSSDHSAAHYGSTGSAHAPAANGSEAVSTQPNQAEIDQFLEVARKQFTELQKVWDNGDIAAIRGFVTESMAYGLEKQLAERGSAANHTSVVSLHVEWLGMDDATDEDGRPVDEAYVRFYGLIRETLDGAAESFDEVWTLQKPKDGSGGWLLAGILQQQAS